MDRFANPQDIALEREVEKPALPPRKNWVLMGDVATVRAGVPEPLIQWRRARGESDPDPQL